MGWRIIEIENSDNINLFLGNLVTTVNNEKVTISIKDIDVLLINNYKTKISIQLLNELANNNVLTIICDNKYLPNSICLPIIGNYNTFKIFEQQLNWNHTFKSNLWKNIIVQKIENQANVILKLKNNFQGFSEIMEFSLQVKDYDITNREGHASKVYWHNLFGINFKRHNDDYVNSLLNYGYTILRGYFTRSIIKKGLDPRISLFHKSFHNYFALSSDLMEVFRCIVDVSIFGILKETENNFYNDKQKIIESFNKTIKYNGKEFFINVAIDKFIDHIVNQEEFPELNFDTIYECL